MSENKVNRQITIREVAKEAGCSIGTVSKVINNLSGVKPEMKQKVWDAIEDLNYTPNFNARLLKQKKTKNIGLFLPAIHGPYFHRLSEVIYQECRKEGYSLEIFVSDLYPSELLALNILMSPIEGAIIMHEGITDKAVETLSRKKMPIVFLDREIAESCISSVIIDNREGMRMIFDHVFANGHRDIAYLQGHDNYDNKCRLEEFLNGVERENLVWDENLLLNGYFETPAAYYAVREFLNKNERAKKGEVPDAFVCANDAMARGCIKALEDTGICVPDDVSVTGFDGDEISDYFQPELTTVKNPILTLGRATVKELFSLMTEMKTGEIIQLNMSLRVRESVRTRKKD